MRTLQVLRLFPVLAVTALATGIQAQSDRPATSAVANDCEDTRGCVPASTSLFVLYAVDAVGGAIAGLPVVVVPDGADLPPQPPAVSARTDQDGMAAVSVRPDRSYTVRITEPGWIPLAAALRMTTAGGTRVYRVVMRVPPIEDQKAR